MLFKVNFWSSVTPSVLMVSENGTRMPAIVGEAMSLHHKFDENMKGDSKLLIVLHILFAQK